MSELNGEEVIGDAPAEVTLEMLAAKQEAMANAIGILLLAISQYPLPRDLMVHLVKALGVEFDESQAFRPKSVIVPPSGILKGN